MNPSSNLTKMKKKRKRDEIEVEYETSKLYRAVYDLEMGKICDRVGEKRKKLENLEDMMVSKEGFDDEDKLSRTVFVANLPFKVKKKVVFKEFGGFGEVESVRIRSVPLLDIKTIRNGGAMKKETNECVDSVHAYIVFKSMESARDALSHNMAVIGGNHIRVDRACPPHKKLKGDPTPFYDHKSLDVSPGEGVMSSKKRGFEESETPGSSNIQNHTRKRVNLDASNQKAEEPIERKRKSATLALRKAKALKSGSASETSGVKRKLGNQTPESADQKKKGRIN